MPKEKTIKKEQNKKNSQKAKVLVVLGPTGSGKTKLALALARHYKGEIVSADSRQVYRGMDIGTGKDLADYGHGRSKVPYHLIDVADPDKGFDLARFQKSALTALAKIIKKGRLPILVGGSGLYLQAVVDNYNLAGNASNEKKRSAWERLTVAELFSQIENINPAFAAKINNSDRHNKRRLARYLEIVEQGSLPLGRNKSAYNFIIFGLSPEREILRKKNSQRLEDRLEAGLVVEVKKLHRDGLSWQKLESFGLEYKFVSRYLQKKIDYESMVANLETAINQFAKRQLAWFKRWQRQGQKIIWFKDPDKALVKITRQHSDLKE